MMDCLDKISISLIIALSILTLGMVVEKSIHDRLLQETKERASAKAAMKTSQPDLKIYGEVENLIKSKHYKKAFEKLQKIINESPQKIESQLYMAKIYAKQGNMEKAASVYRKSIEKSPNLLELASVELWDLVQKGIPKLHREKKLKPDDKRVKSLLSDLYFLQRKLGQGCE